MKLDLTQETVFGFEGPNMCLLGNEEDFKKLAVVIVDITGSKNTRSIEINSLNFVDIVGIPLKVIFSSKEKAEKLGVLDNDNLLFELDNRYWERIFKYFVLMSWKKSTYYLNSFEDCLRDLPLDQEYHLICSSEF